MGQMHIMLAREYGAGKVIGADMVPFRLNKALEFGADHVIDVSKEDMIEKLKYLTNGYMADIVVVGPNSADAMRTGIQSASRGGTVVLFTPAKPDELLTINPNEIYFRDINLITTYSCGPDDTREALRFIEKSTVSADKLITHRFPIEQTAEAFKLTSQAGESLKSLIVFD
jgi:L-iditol 2-dehydrogenase